VGSILVIDEIKKEATQKLIFEQRLKEGRESMVY
jgi:hypothetical protein